MRSKLQLFINTRMRHQEIAQSMARVKERIVIEEETEVQAIRRVESMEAD